MIDNIEEPVASAIVTWPSPEQGGRRSGPPTAPVYAANCTFPMGGEAEVATDWPATAEKFSLLLQLVTEMPTGAWACKLDFLARDLAIRHLRPGARMLVLEGPKVVGHARIVEVFLDVDAGEFP